MRCAARLETDPADIVILCVTACFSSSIAVALFKHGDRFVTYDRGLIRRTLVFRRVGRGCFDAIRRVGVAARTDHSGLEDADRRVPRRPAPTGEIDRRFWERIPCRGRGAATVARLATMFHDSPGLLRIDATRAFSRCAKWISRPSSCFRAPILATSWVIRVTRRVLPSGRWPRERSNRFSPSFHTHRPPSERERLSDDDRISYSLWRQAISRSRLLVDTGPEMAMRGNGRLAGRTHYRCKGFHRRPSSPQD